MLNKFIFHIQVRGITKSSRTRHRVLAVAALDKSLSMV